jgi:small multidrug resistance family-3 protein
MYRWLWLILAAALEVGGDALVRWGLKSGRMIGFILGATVLFTYGLTVNLPDWDFGKLLGIYIVLFFIVSQLVSVLAFGETIPLSRWIGGSLVVTGGLWMMFAK